METHIDTRRLNIDQDLRERLASRTSAPDANGCQFYLEGKTSWGAHIEARTLDNQPIATSVLRVAHVVAGLGHVALEQEVVHSCGNTIQGHLCIAPDHLNRLSALAAKREKDRKRHQIRMAS